MCEPDDWNVVGVVAISKTWFALLEDSDRPPPSIITEAVNQGNDNPCGIDRLAPSGVIGASARILVRGAGRGA
jgi:hypothetical protein